MHEIAKETLNPKTHRPIRYATVKDKVIRKFSPDLTSVAQFDMMLERYLSSGDPELRAVLLRRAEGPDEEKAIRDALPLQGTH
jgi:hypothetical protein